MPKEFTWKIGLLVLLWGVAVAVSSCTTARAHLVPADRAGVPSDEFPAASPGYLTPAPPSQIQAP